MSGAGSQAAGIYGFQGARGKGEIYVRKMWLSSSFISQFCNGKQAFHKHIPTKPSVKWFGEPSLLTMNCSININLILNNNINNNAAINHTAPAASHPHAPGSLGNQSCSISSFFLALLPSGSIRKSSDAPEHKPPTLSAAAVEHLTDSKQSVELHQDAPKFRKAHPEGRDYLESCSWSRQIRRAAQAEGVKSMQIKMLPFWDEIHTNLHSHSMSLFAVLGSSWGLLDLQQERAEILLQPSPAQGNLN